MNQSKQLKSIVVSMSVIFVFLLSIGCQESDPIDSYEFFGDRDTSNITYGSDSDGEYVKNGSGDSRDSDDNYESNDSEGIDKGYPNYLLHTNEGNLWHINLETAKATKQCELQFDEGVSPVAVFPSLTFTADDRLMASDGNALWEIELPSCETRKLLRYFPDDDSYAGVAGICPDTGTNLYGISSGHDSLLHIDVASAETEVIGPLGHDFGNHGGTFDVKNQELLGLAAPYGEPDIPIIIE